ncbi:MAG: hypothetical protein ACREV4_17095 [Gammaproteobacteria bacterium]
MTPEMVNGLFALGGAALGAVLTGAFSLYQSKKTLRKKELAIYTTAPSRLLAVDSTLKDLIVVTINGKKVPTVYIVDTVIANTGNEVLNDLKAKVCWEGKGEIVSTEIGRANFDPKLDEIAIARVGDLEIDISASYLNPGDELVVRSLFSGRPSKWRVEFRQPGVSLNKRLTDTGLPNIFAKAMFEGIRSNWILDSYFKLALPQYRKYLESLDRESKNA